MVVSLVVMVVVVVVYTEDAIGQDYSQIFSWDDPAARRQTGKQLCAKFEEILVGYHAQVDAEGVVVDAPASKKRRGRRQKQNQKEAGSCQMPDDSMEIKIGSLKQQAVKNILMYCTPESYRMMCCHMSNFVGGGERQSALRAEALSWKHFWPGSPPPPDQIPNEAEEVARRSAAGVARKLLPERVTCFV